MADKRTYQSSESEKVIQSLTIRQARVESADITTWREAVNSAKSGFRSKLYNLYENLLADPVLADAVDKRVGAITNAEITFQRNGNNVEAIDDLIDTPAFELLIREIVLTKGWGKSVIEAMFAPDFDVFSFPRKHIYIANLERRLSERKRYIIEREGMLTGYEYANDPWILECGDDYDLGFLFRAAPYVIYKRGGFGDWAQFAEIFGMPFLIGKYAGMDTATRDKLFDALAEIGSNPRAAIPKEAELQVVENKSSGSNTLYKDFRAACNEEILIAVLGNTMTTISGSSRSQGEVHQDTQEDIAQADRRYVQRQLNKWLVPLLIARGYDAAGGFFSFPDQGENMTTKERVDMALQLKKEGIPVSNDYFYEITGIPKAEVSDPKPPKTDPPKPAAGKGSSGADQKKGLRNFFAEAPAKIGASRQNFISRSIDSIAGNIKLSDSYSINIASLFDEALREIWNEQGSGQPFNPRLFDITNTALQDGISLEVGKESVEWGQTNAAFIREFRENTAVFAAFKSHQQTNEIVDLLIDEKGDLRSFSKFKKLALDVSKDYNVSWLQTEYNTAVRSARAAVNFRKYLATEHLYPNLEYLESVAEHQRGDHLTYVGTILPIRHVWWETHMPPSAWNCQCSVKPTNKAATAVPGEDEPIDPVFANNPGQTAKLVNTEATAYYTNTDAALRQQIEDMARRAERIRQRLEEIDFKRKSYKSGGYIDVPTAGQNANEAKNNIKIASTLAKQFADKYALLPVRNEPGKKSPDAINLKNYLLSDFKTQGGQNARNTIQAGIREASAQKAGEVVIRLINEASYKDVKSALYAALQPGRAATLRKIVIMHADGRLVRYDADLLRKVFWPDRLD